MRLHEDVYGSDFLINERRREAVRGHLRVCMDLTDTSLRGLARRLRISHIAVHEWLSGKRPIPGKRLRQLVRMFPSLGLLVEELRKVCPCCGGPL